MRIPVKLGSEDPILPLRTFATSFPDNVLSPTREYSVARV
jgi:hypothetical protein